MSLLSIGTSALLTSQGGLSTTSNNISNVNTDGYSRQRANQSTLTPEMRGGNYFGTGVQISSVERMYDNFLSGQVRLFTSQQGQQSTFHSYASQVDDMMGSEALGLNNGFSAFFNAVSEVADDPTSIAARQVMLSEADALAKRFNTLDSNLTQLDRQVDYDITTAVEKINNLSESIADLNQSILEARGTNQAEPNDLLDKRDQLINELSEYVSVNTLTQSDGSVTVMVGSGQALVVGSSNYSLSTITDTSTTPPRLGIGHGTNGVDITAQITGGSIGGALEFRSSIIDDARAELNLLAQSLVEGFNAVHNNVTNLANGGAGAVDLNGNGGGDFFDAANITAATISVAITDPRLIAASSQNNAGAGNNENALLLADLQSDSSLVTVSAGVTRSLSEHYGVVVADVATRTGQAEASLETQSALLQQTQQRFDSVSGVNLDEEAASLIKYQQAYQAASQIIVVSNTIFDSLISAV